jgi:hypothetical protein
MSFRPCSEGSAIDGAIREGPTTPQADDEGNGATARYKMPVGSDEFRQGASQGGRTLVEGVGRSQEADKIATLGRKLVPCLATASGYVSAL